MYEAGTLCTDSTAGSTGTEICDRYEEVDTTFSCSIQGGTKRSGEDSESVEPFTVGSAGQPRKKRKEFEPQRIAKSKVELIEELLDTYVFSPPNIITNSLYWANHEEARFISPTSPEFMLACNNHQTRLSNMSFDDLVLYYRKQRIYTFRPGVAYHTVEDSIKHAMTWLEEMSQVAHWLQPTYYGYDRCKIPVKQWLQLISNVVNRRERKRFALIFQGPTSCGKTWFTNMLLDFYLNKGQLNNWNRYSGSTFHFMGLVNRRIALWNEALLNGDPEQKEDLKVIFEGEAKTVGVKNQRDGTVAACPIIVTSNNQTMEKVSEFKERQHVFQLEKVSCINGGPDCMGKQSLHPFAWPYLMQHYSIDVDESATVSKHCQVMCLEDFMHFDALCINSL